MSGALVSYFCFQVSVCVLMYFYANKTAKKRAVSHYIGGCEKVRGDPKDSDHQEDTTCEREKESKAG